MGPMAEPDGIGYHYSGTDGTHICATQKNAKTQVKDYYYSKKRVSAYNNIPKLSLRFSRL